MWLLLSRLQYVYLAPHLLGEIVQTKTELDEIVTSTEGGKVQQKVRVSEKSESLFRLCLLLGLLAVIALAAYSIYMLHKIADYEVKCEIHRDIAHMYQ